MLLDRDTRAESTAVWSCIENNRYDFPLIRALVERCRNLSHHGDVENIDGRARQGHARDATFNAEFDVLVIAVHSLKREPLTPTCHSTRLRSQESSQCAQVHYFVKGAPTQAR